MLSPHWCYAAAFSAALLAYTLGWSDLYPDLSASLFIFLLLTLLLHGILGWRLKPNARRPLNYSPAFSPVIITLALYILWIFEFVYAGGIPLAMILLRQPFDYRLFGVPSLHVALVTFSSFYTLVLFRELLHDRNKLLLALFAMNLAAGLLIYNRGMVIFELAGCVLLYFNNNIKFSWRTASLFAAGVIAAAWLFGAMGTIRVSAEAHRPYDNRLFMDTGGASYTFRQSGIPGEFFWDYVYLTSPIANLQENINKTTPPPAHVTTVLEFINNELLFDFISKRINRLFDIERPPEHLIVGPFNVSTVYSGSYSHLGWTGMICMALFVAFLPYGYQSMLRHTPRYADVGMATLGSLFLFMVFDNTLRFTGLGFQLVYPFVFPLLEQIHLRMKKRIP